MIGLFWLFSVLGFVAHAVMAPRLRRICGVIVVEIDERSDKIVYSLVLDIPLEDLAFKKEVIFKVDTSVTEFYRT